MELGISTPDLEMSMQMMHWKGRSIGTLKECKFAIIRLVFSQLLTIEGIIVIQPGAVALQTSR